MGWACLAEARPDPPEPRYWPVTNTRTRAARSDRARPQPGADPPVRVVSGPAFELIAELAAFESGPARAALESGKTWIRDVRRLAGPELIRRVDDWAFPLYAELVPIALEAGEPFAIERAHRADT